MPAFHVAALNYVATAGLMVGMGIYGIRVFSSIKDPKLAELRDTLRDLKALYAAGEITRTEYRKDRKAARKEAGFAD